MSRMLLRSVNGLSKSMRNLAEYSESEQNPGGSQKFMSIADVKKEEENESVERPKSEENNMRETPAKEESNSNISYWIQTDKKSYTYCAKYQNSHKSEHSESLKIRRFAGRNAAKVFRNVQPGYVYDREERQEQDTISELKQLLKLVSLGLYGTWRDKRQLPTKRQIRQLKALLSSEIKFGIYELLEDCIIDQMIVLLKQFQQWNDSPYQDIYPYLKTKYNLIVKYILSNEFQELQISQQRKRIIINKVTNFTIEDPE